METIYQSNEVMEVIGKQEVCKYIAGGQVGFEDFLKVLEAHQKASDPNCNDLFAVGVDFFALGMIYGRKAERAEKNGGTITPLAN